jgi:hypothetical protein
MSKIEQKPLSVEEMKELVELISWAVNWCEHGIITFDFWENECGKFSKFLRDRGYNPHGQWTSLGEKV